MKPTQRAGRGKGEVLLRAGVLWLAISAGPVVHAFEVSTHAEISFQAARSSTMKERDPQGQAAFLKKLGFVDQRDLTNLGAPWRTFYEFTGAGIEERAARDYEDAIIERVRTTSPVLLPRTGIEPLTRWLMRGSVREDDLGAEVLGTPVDGENDNGLVRVFNHFLDPQNDRGLTVAGLCPGGIGGCKRSADWALGFVDFRAATPKTEGTASTEVRQDSFALAKPA